MTDGGWGGRTEPSGRSSKANADAREKNKRFGEYLLTSLAERPEAFDPHLDLPEVAA